MLTQFQFNSATKEYVKNLAIVREVQESAQTDLRDLLNRNLEVVRLMRAETYSNIAAFGDELLGKIAGAEPWKNVQIQSMKTTPQGRYAGGKIHYLWIDSASRQGSSRKPCEIGMVYFGLPVAGKVPFANDEAWENYWSAFDLISNDRLKVWIGYEGADEGVRSRIQAIGRSGQLVTFIQQESSARTSMWLPIERSNPVDSAARKLTALVKAIYEAEKGN